MEDCLKDIYAELARAGKSQSQRLCANSACIFYSGYECYDGTFRRKKLILVVKNKGVYCDSIQISTIEKWRFLSRRS